MTEHPPPEDQVPEDRGRRDQLLEEASLWFARMRGPDADSYKSAFDAWLARGAAHLGAYNRAAEIFSMGKFLADPERHDSPETAPRRRRTPPGLLFAGAALIVLVAVWLGMGTPASLRYGGGSDIAGTRRGPHGEPLLLATGGAQGKSFALSDGSRVTLDRDTRLVVSYNAGARALRLVQGRTRFDVAHGTRPFIVYAGSGSVTAHGTVFEVAIDPRQRVKVRLLRGAIDVALTARDQPVRHLQPGQQVSFTRAAISSPATDMRETITPALPGEFDGVPLSDLLADANRRGGRRIGLADPALGALRISGRFSLDDPARLAARLAALQDLAVDDSDPARITLRRRPDP